MLQKYDKTQCVSQMLGRGEEEWCELRWILHPSSNLVVRIAIQIYYKECHIPHTSTKNRIRVLVFRFNFDPDLERGIEKNCFAKPNEENTIRDRGSKTLLTLLTLLTSRISRLPTSMLRIT